MRALYQELLPARAWLGRVLLPWRLGGRGANLRLGAGLRVFHPSKVFLADDVRVGAGTYLIANTERAEGIQIGRGARIGSSCYLAATDGQIVIGREAWLGAGVVAYGNGGLTIEAGAWVEDEVAISTINHRCERRDAPIRAQGLELAPVRIGAAARIGRGAILLPGVRVGAGARVAPGSVVTRDVPPRAQVAGVPAQPCEVTTLPPPPARRTLGAAS